MKKSAWIIVAILIITICVIAIFSQNNNIETKEIVKIGVILPLTGSATELASQHKKGIDFAIEEINKNVKSKKMIFEVIYEDDQNNPKQTVAAVNKLISYDKIIAIITVMSGPSLAIAPILEEKGIPHFANCGNPYITNMYSNVFRNFPSSTLEIEAISDYIVDYQKLKTCGILYIDDAYGKGAEEIAQKIFPEKGIDILISETYGKTGINNKIPAIKIINAKPDFIYVYGYGKATAEIINTLKEIGYSGKICGSYNFSQPPLTTISRTSIENSIYTVPTYDRIGYDTNRKFWDKFIDKFGCDPLWNAVVEYDALNIIVKAYLKDSDNLIRSLNMIGNYNGIGGEYIFIGSKDWLLPMSVASRVNNEIIYLK